MYIYNYYSLPQVAHIPSHFDMAKKAISGLFTLYISTSFYFSACKNCNLG